MDDRKVFHTRGYLPHLDPECGTQFVTWRLADALPPAAIQEITDHIDHLPESERKRERYRRVEAYLDAGHGSCILRRPDVAIVLQSILREGDGGLYHLHRWVIMPNHVHVLLTLEQYAELGHVIQRIKGSTSHAINRLLGQSGRLWQPEYFDRLIRDAAHLEKVGQYIEWNPVKAKLCADPKHWPYSSASAIHRDSPPAD